MSIEQFVRYKQQLRKVTADFLKLANMLDNDQLEIVVARMVDRVNHDPDAAFQDKYRGLVLAILLEMRQARQVQQALTILDKEKIKKESANYWHGRAMGKLFAVQAHNQAVYEDHKAELAEWKRGVSLFNRLTGNTPKPRPLEPKYAKVPASYSSPEQAYKKGKERWSEYLVNKVADFPIVPSAQRPEGKTPDECAPTKQEIKGLLEA